MCVGSLPYTFHIGSVRACPNSIPLPLRKRTGRPRASMSPNSIQCRNHHFAIFGPTLASRGEFSAVCRFRFVACFHLLLGLCVLGCTGKSDVPQRPSTLGALPRDEQEPIRTFGVSPKDWYSAEVPEALPSLESRLSRKQQAKHDAILDPDKDGWRSEAFSEDAQRIVDQFATILFGESEPTVEQLKDILHSSYVGTRLRPQSLKVVFDDGCMVVQRASDSSLSGDVTFQGLEGAVRCVREYDNSRSPHPTRQFHTKVIRVAATKTGAATEHLVEMTETSDSSVTEQFATWNCEWRMDGNTPKLSGLHISEYEESSARGRLYSDQTALVLGKTRAFQEQLRLGLNHWLSQIETTHGMYVFAEYGLAVGDVNGDGREDIYIAQPAGLPNRLFLSDEQGTLVDASRASGVDWLDHTSSALILDFDNDDDQDLAIAMESKNVVFMENDGTGKFTVATQVPLADRHVQGLSAADYDNDGKLDVYLTIGFADEKARMNEQRPSFVYYDANEGGANVMLRNEISASAWKFSDVTATIGLDHNNRRHSLAAAWEDYDNDGDQDLYVANDYGQNCLYENTNGVFRDIAVESGVEDFGSGMSVSWGDYDHDGNMDLYVGNMFSSAGNRVTRQVAFQRQIASDARDLLTRFAKGNSLFRNLGQGKFTEVGEAAGVEFGRWAWSSLFCDVNNDGWEDILVANGYITGDDDRDL